MTQPPSDQSATHPRSEEEPPPPMMIYTDGSCVNNGLLNAKNRAGVWVNDTHPLNRAVRVLGPHQSNQVGELAAVLIALQTAPQKADLTIPTDPQYIIQALNHSLKTWEDTGWVNT